MTDEEILLKKLFDHYNPTARPVLDSVDSVQVSIEFSLMHIKDLVSKRKKKQTKKMHELGGKALKKRG